MATKTKTKAGQDTPPVDAGAIQAARQELADAAQAAQEALVRLTDAADAHDQAVQQAAAQLRQAGHTDQAGPTWVEVGGATYRAVNVGVALGWVAHRVAAARLPLSHRLTDWLQRIAGRNTLDWPGSPLADVPPVPALPRTNPFAVLSQIPQAVGAPVAFRSASERREAERRRDEAVQIRQAVR